MPAPLNLEIVEAQLQYIRQIRQDLERIIAVVVRERELDAAPSPTPRGAAPAKRRSRPE